MSAPPDDTTGNTTNGSPEAGDSTAADPSTSITFTPLHTLPLELRFMIYRHTWEPKTITISSPGVGRIRDYPELPVTLRINSETRQETLRHYYECNVWSRYVNHTTNESGERCRKAYINPSLDTLYLDHFPTITRIDIPTPPVKKPCLRIILSAYIDQPGALELLHAKSGLEPLILEMEVEQRITRRRRLWGGLVTERGGRYTPCFGPCPRTSFNFWFDQRIRRRRRGLSLAWSYASAE
ncbi:uncharacterized protein PODANS_2_7020 [Podospora anserina S mat+]|uniref:Podospora anserina S mat+ genomic DNA chromosome 2, supercontig 2 n=1 Tax=Podospora anserina (strain S / ATCC MYA-4624 / DSM 980 / FGSC 10383) TaxID=515849 RepID=B2B684_PODAN|nr:uncharacterized protein PODANS_2_7020 [Podospora anserina S mat+]CAP73309.1 unnamed protein product [Podospora anserina S mat+]CDP25712.1 Putative protein of unknown function [Podospora anserina S mat+]